MTDLRAEDLGATGKPEPQSFGALLRHYRLAANLSQDALAERSGLSLRAISDLERGARRAPHGDTVRLLADGLDLAAEDRRSLEGSVDRHRSPARAAGRVEDLSAARTESDLLPMLPASIGREQELAELAQLVARSEVRLLTLTGPAGVGKTHLALALRAHLDGHFPQGITFVDLTPIREPTMLLPAIAEHLGLPNTGCDSPLHCLQDCLRDQAALLILDNFEQVLSAAPQLPQLLATCPGITLLITSREPLRLRAEQTFQVGPLALPDPLHPAPLPELAQIPAVALFVERAKAIAPAFELNADNARAVVELCVRLDGLPLALELAAARTSVLSPQMMLDRLADRLTLLRWNAQDLPERQQTLQAAMAWSYELLEEAEKALFRTLSVFAGGFAIEAAEALAEAVGLAIDDVLEGISSLVAKNLLLSEEYGGDQRRLRMLDSIRDYALEELRSCHELDATRRAHAVYFVALAERAEPELRGPGQRAWFLRLEREIENLRAALHWLSSQGHPELALRLTVALAYFWETRGFLAEEARWLEEGLARTPEAAPGLRATALSFLGKPLFVLGQRGRGAAALREALALGRSLDDGAIVVRSLATLGVNAAQENDWEEARRLLDEAVHAAESLGEVWWAAWAKMRLASIAAFHGRRDWTEGLAQEALAVFRPLGDDLNIAMALIVSAVALAERGEISRAAAALQESLAIGSSFQDRYLLSFGVVAVLALAGEHTEATELTRLIGAIEVLSRPDVMYPPLLLEFVGDRAAALRQRIGPEECDAALAFGRSLSLTETVALARRLLDDLIVADQRGAGARLSLSSVA